MEVFALFAHFPPPTSSFFCFVRRACYGRDTQLLNGHLPVNVDFALRLFDLSCFNFFFPSLQVVNIVQCSACPDRNLPFCDFLFSPTVLPVFDLTRTRLC